MARYIAIGEAPGLTEAQFRERFNEVKKWRFDKRSWVVKAYCVLGEGKVVIECETPEKGQFEEWLKKTGWKVNGVYGVNLIHEAGSIWPV